MFVESCESYSSLTTTMYQLLHVLVKFTNIKYLTVLSIMVAKFLFL